MTRCIVRWLCCCLLTLPCSIAIADSAAGGQAEEGQGSPTENRQQVPIGVIVPLTGGLAKRGNDVTTFAPLVVEHFNSLSERYRYVFLIDDGKCGAGNAPTTIAKKLIHVDKVQFLITGCSGETLQAAPVAQRNKVLTIAILSTHQDIKHLGEYVYRTFVDIERSIHAFAEYMAKQSGGKIALLTEENAFTYGIKELLEQQLGPRLVFSDDYPAGTSDFNTLLTRIRGSGAQGVYFNALSENTLAILVNQGRALGLRQRFYSYNMPEASTFREATGKNAEGMEFIGSPDVEHADEAFNKLLALYKERYPEGPSYEFILRTFFDAVLSIVAGVEAVGPDASKVNAFLKTYRGSGALGEIAYDQNGDIENVNYFLRRISEGKNLAIGDMTALQ